MRINPQSGHLNLHPPLSTFWTLCFKHVTFNCQIWFSLVFLFKMKYSVHILGLKTFAWQVQPNFLPDQKIYIHTKLKQSHAYFIMNIYLDFWNMIMKHDLTYLWKDANLYFCEVAEYIYLGRCQFMNTEIQHDYETIANWYFNQTRRIHLSGF